MLEHHDQQNDQELPAAQVRVKSEELARAIAAIEARRQEEAEQLEGTVVLGDVVQDLQLDITPEELLAEVEAQREYRASAQTTPTRKWTTEEEVQRDFWRGMKIGGSILAATTFVIWLASSNNSPPHFVAPTLPQIQPQIQYHGRWQERLGPLDAAFHQKLAQCLGPHPTYKIFMVPFDNLMMEGNSNTLYPNTLYPLNAVPDGYPFYGSPAMQGGWAPTLFTFQPTTIDNTLGPRVWAFTRYAGRYYQRGWIYQSDKERVLQGHLTGFYPIPNPPYMPPHNYIPLTLALGSYSGRVRTPSAREQYVLLQEGHKAKLDSHAWDQDLYPSPFRNQTPGWGTKPLTFSQAYYYSAGFDASSVLKPLAEVPNGRTIHCNRETMTGLLYASRLHQGQVVVDARENLAQPWTITKLNGRAYLRGWVAARISSQQLEERTIWIYADAKATEFIAPPVQITVPLDGITFQRFSRPAPTLENFPGQIQNIPGMELSNVTLDEHAWETWESQ